VPRSIPGRQKVVRLKYSHRPKKVFTRNGNRYARWIFRKPSRSFTIQISAVMDLYQYDLSVVSARKRRHKGLGKKARRKYLAHERFLEKNNKTIRSVARRIKGRTEVEKIQKIMAFVQRWLRTSKWSPTKKEFGAVGALQKRHGVCAEYSDLFVALCRAKKIPARVCEGYLVTPIAKGDTPQHAWTEAYTRAHGWVPFDPMHSKGGAMNHVEANRIYLTGTRNDRVINRGHIYYFRYWGKAQVKNDFVVRGQKVLAAAPHTTAASGHPAGGK
jgi:transglutaminase-like putative cysteine protease